MPAGIYRHFKGRLVVVLGTAQHSETLEEYVVYRHRDEENYWVRPLAMFLETVEHEGRSVPRFEHLATKEALEELAKNSPDGAVREG